MSEQELTEVTQDDAPESSQNDDRAGKPKVGLLWLFVLLTLIISGGAAFGVYQLLQKGDARAAQASGQMERSETAIIDLRDDLNEVESGLDDAKHSRESIRNEITDEFDLLKKTVDKQARHLKEISSSNRDQWLIAEVEYLLRLANQRILMSKDAGGALAMLDSADGVLQGIDDVSLHNVRKAIAADMASLRGLATVDVDGAYLQLSAIAEQLGTLPLYEIDDFEVDALDTEMESMPEDPDFQQRLQRGLDRIKSALSQAFIVRNDNDSIDAMLPPQDELYLRQNMRLMVEQAQLALLSRKPTVYASSLEKAQRWLAQYYLLENAGTQAVLEGLNELSGLDVDPPLPDISGSFRALKKYQQAEANARPGLDYEAQATESEAIEPEPSSAAEEATEEVAQEAAEEAEASGLNTQDATQEAPAEADAPSPAASEPSESEPEAGVPSSEPQASEPAEA